MNRRAATLLELLLLLALCGLIVPFALIPLSPERALAAAREVRSVLLTARAHAIWGGVPVSVTELPGAGGVVARAELGGAPCGQGPGREIARADLSGHPGVRMLAGLPRGLVWLPSGSGRSCQGGGVISATLRLEGVRSRINVIISSLGRVRLERP